MGKILFIFIFSFFVTGCYENSNAPDLEEILDTEITIESSEEILASSPDPDPVSTKITKPEIEEYIKKSDIYLQNGGNHLEEIGTAIYRCPGCFDALYEFRTKNEGEAIDVKVIVRFGKIEGYEVVEE